MYKTATITYTYGNGLISDSRKEAKDSDTENLRFLYNGRYGVETGANGLYYMRARYYNPQIKRFINRDIIDGSITDSQSLNKYSYVQGNPVNLIDPFGLCAQDYFSRAGHELLDWLGFIFDPADAINFLWYTAEGNAAMAAATAVAIVPAAGSFIAKGTKQAIKAGKKAAQKATEKAAKNATEKAAKKAAKKKLAKEATETGVEKAAKEAAEKAGQKTAKEVTEKSAERTAREAVEKGAKGGSNAISDLSNKAVKHPMNDHMPARYAKQLQYMSKDAAEQYLSYKTFFNQDWTDEQVRAALNCGYKEALNNGVTTGKYSFEYLGEKITVYLEEGMFKTGYGDYIYTYDELLKLLGGI